MAYNTNLSRSRGRGFEVQVVKRLHALGYQAKKMLLSGGHLAKPYDVIVRPYRLKIEAKRTMKNHITMQAKWLNKVSDKLIIVFAVGKYGGRGTIEMFALSPGTMDTVKMTDPIGGAVIMKKAKKIDKEKILSAPFLILYNKKNYLVEKFEDYMARKYSLTNKEIIEDVRPTEHGGTITA
mgnify:CR=1 FL=1